MTFFQLFSVIHHHRQLAMRRSLDFQRNRVSSCLRLVFGLLFVLYLVFMSILLALSANENGGKDAVKIITATLPLILFIDFILRFSMQETPAQIIRPYILFAKMAIHQNRITCRFRSGWSIGCSDMMQ